MSDVICVVDADGFEVQVLQKFEENRHTIDRPCAVADVSTGRILAVSPEAKALGLSRDSILQNALNQFPQLQVIPKPYKFHKPESQTLRHASYNMRSCIVNFIYNKMEHPFDLPIPIEKSGSDEFFINITQYVNGIIAENKIANFFTTRKITLEGEYEVHKGEDLIHMIQTNNFYRPEEHRLSVGLRIMDELIPLLEKETGLKCSAGTGSNKVLAKLGCKLSKPFGNTAMTHGGMLRASHAINFRDITGFGGDLGDKIEQEFGPMNISELRRHLNQRADLYYTGNFNQGEVEKIRDLSQGICKDVVEQKLMDRKVSCGKYKLRLNDDMSEFKKWLLSLSQEMEERIKEEREHNERYPTKMFFKYEKTVANSRPKLKSFELIPDRVAFSRINAQSLYDLAFEMCVVNNTSFYNDLQFMTGMSFNIPQFENVFGRPKFDFYNRL